MCGNCQELFKFSKMIEKFSKRMLKKNKGTTSPVPITSIQKNRLVKTYINTKNTYERNLLNNMRKLQSGKLSLDQYLEMQRLEIKKAFEKAYSLGKDYGTASTVLDDSERRFIVQQTTKEMQFMSNFANDIQNGSGKMDYRKRMGMYVSSLDSMFGFGRLVYMPEDVKIIWMLGATDKHCLDCISIAANNPYTKKTLPGFPKSGNSRCLSNCLCSINYIYNNQGLSSDYESFILSKKFSDVGKRKIPSEYDYKFLNGLRDEYYYNRYMYELTKDNKYKEGYQTSLKEFNAYKKKNQVYFPVYFNIQQNLIDVKAFNTNNKFEFTSDYLSVRDNSFISFFQGNKQLYGKVVGRYGSQLRIRTLDKVEYLIASSTHIVFKEK